MNASTGFLLTFLIQFLSYLLIKISGRYLKAGLSSKLKISAANLGDDTVVSSINEYSGWFIYM